MRIALITDGIWPYVLGGMQKHSYYLCKYLAQQKVQVDLYHFNESKYDISKLEFFTEEERSYIHPVVIDFPKGRSFPGHYLYKNYQYSKLIFEHIQPQLQNYDLIYTKGFTGWYLIEQKHKGKINCARIGVKFHGYEMFQKPPSFKIRLQHLFLLRKPVRALSRKADLVFSYGGKITQLIRKIGVADSKIYELPSGVEAASIADSTVKGAEKIRFLFLGRYERRKGIEELNTAINDLIHQYKQLKAEFHFIGPIPEHLRMRDEHFIYHGEIRDKGILQEHLRRCDILICPSWSEGMPNVILEAMANGLTVIATDVGATNVLVNEKTGWLLAEPDPELIKNTLDKLIKLEPRYIYEKKQEALDLIKNKFTWEKLIHEFCDDLLK